jgi:hypothetical protein
MGYIEAARNGPRSARATSPASDRSRSRLLSQANLSAARARSGTARTAAVELALTFHSREPGTSLSRLRVRHWARPRARAAARACCCAACIWAPARGDASMETPQIESLAIVKPKRSAARVVAERVKGIRRWSWLKV